MKINVLLICFGWVCLYAIGCSPTRKLTPAPVMEIKKEIKNEVAAEAKSVEIVTAKTDTFLLHLLETYPYLFGTVLHNKNNQVQIIYTQINRDEQNKPQLTPYYFNVDPALYYYPASTVKMPVAALALQRLHELNLPGLDKNTTMITDAGFAGQTAVYNDPTTPDGRPTIAQYIKKIFLVSDNDAFNRLYEFLGQEYINNNLHKMGYTDVQILHRLDLPMTEEQYRYTNPVTFFNAASQPIYAQPLTYSKLPYAKRKNFLGKGYYKGDQLLNEPFDFSKKNRLALTDLNAILQSIVFPETVKKSQRFNLTEDDHQFLLQYMSMKPGESLYPQYDTSVYNDSYSKFLLLGAAEPLDSNMRIFNKEGDAYGFLTDAAYIVDFKNGIEFMLSATILCNNDGIYNDDHYDYETIGFPFLQNLGRVLYDYELRRKKKNVPDLSRFKLNYGR